mgnify:CR=1 FL=1
MEKRLKLSEDNILKTAKSVAEGIVHYEAETFDGKEYKKEGVEIRLEDFYGKMVAESNVFPLTAAPSPNDYYEVFKEKAKEGKDILCICISTKLSSSMQSAEIAAKMLAEKYPDIQVKIIDSLACTLMQSLEEKFGTTETVPIHRIGATIGVHTGPYAIGIGIIRRSDMV